MTIVKAVVDTLDSDGDLVQRRDESIISSRIKRNGSRTVDEGEIIFDINTKVNQNDNVKYIQDIVNTSLLTGLWNFQVNGKDESGYDLDAEDTGGDDPDTDTFIRPGFSGNIKKFQSQYGYQCDETGLELTVSSSLDDYSRIDFSKQFDLYIYCQFNNSDDFRTLENGDNAIVFSNADPGTAGFDIGYQIVAGVPMLFARFTYTTGTPQEEVGTQGIFSNQTPSLIRLKRDENNLVSAYLNGILEFSFTESRSMDNQVGLTFANRQHPITDEEWVGEIFQIRAYSGGYLTDNEAELIRTASAQPVTMKLEGKVWRVNDSTNPIKVFIKGTDKIPIEANMTESILTGTTGIRTGNVYGAGELNRAILEDMFSNVDSSFIIKDPSSSTATLNGKFVATQGLIQCSDLLLLEDNESFTIFPNKIFVLESNDGIDTQYEFHQGNTAHNGFVITSSGKDDIVKINDLEVIGRIRHKHGATSVTAVQGNTSTLAHFPLNIRIVDSGGIILEEDATTDGYTVDYETKEITFSSTLTNNNTTFVIEFDYEDLESSADTRMYFRNTSTGSSDISASGRYSRRIFLPQLTHKEDFDQVSQRIITRNRNVNQRYQLVAPGHINNLIENRNIQLVNSIKNIDVSNKVQSIEWTYPQMRTIVQVGEHRFNSFDIQDTTTQSVQASTASTMKTHNSTA